MMLIRVLRLCSTLLNGLNYIPWARAVTLALGGKAKLGFINGKIASPDVHDKSYANWLCKDQLVMCWILNSMESNVVEIFSFFESAKDLWKAVKEMYGHQNNAVRVFQLQKEIAELSQHKKTFTEHLGKLKSLWNELALYRPYTTEAAILLKRAEEDKIFQLLVSLDPKYEDLRSHILMTPELPSFNNVSTTIQREEVRKKVMNSDARSNIETSESKAFVASEKRQFKWKKNNLKCEHCERTNHTKERCWVLYPHLKPKFNKNSKDSAGYKANQAINPTHHISSHDTSSYQTNSTDATANLVSNPYVLLNQFAALLQQYGKPGKPTIDAPSSLVVSGILQAFMSSCNSNSKSNVWMVDTGATDHMTNQKICLHDFVPPTKSKLFQLLMEMLCQFWVKDLFIFWGQTSVQMFFMFRLFLSICCL